MLKEGKIQKQQKQNAPKFQQYAPTLTTNTVNSVTRQRQSSIGGRIRSTSALPKSYNQTAFLNKQNKQAYLQVQQPGLGQSAQNKGLSVKAQPRKGAHLIAWGQLHSSNHKSLTQVKQKNDSKLLPEIKLASNVIKFGLGEKHIVYINSKWEAYGIGSSVFGQLGYPQAIQANRDGFQSSHLPILQQLLIQEVFCTPFSTFLITNREEVYGCGLNNRGQLGIATSGSEESHPGIVSTPTKIVSLSKKSLVSDNCGQYRGRKGSKKLRSGKIQSYALAERNLQNNLIQQSKLLTQKSEGTSSDIYLQTISFQPQGLSSCADEEDNQGEGEAILDEGQFITHITGGPYHSIALSNKGRAFYSGNIYKKSAVLNDEYTSKFAELNLKKIGKVQKVKSGLSCIGLLNNQGSLFLLGAVNQNIICDEPYNVGVSCIVDFGIAKEKIYLVTSVGDVWVIAACKKSLRTYKINLEGYDLASAKVLAVECSLDRSVLMTDKAELLADGSQSLNLFRGQTMRKQNKTKMKNSAVEQYEQSLVKINCKLKLGEIKCGLGYMLGLCDKYPSDDIQDAKQTGKDDQIKQLEEHENLLKRVSELEKQNKILKDMIKDEGTETRNQRSNSARKKDLLTQTQLTGKQHLKRASNDNLGAKFDLNIHLNEKIVSKARKFDNSMEIPFEELELGKQISEGGYGVIYKATWRKTTVAVKIFKIDTNSQNSIKDFISECHAMEALRHPNIVMFLGACTKPPNFAIVLEYCEGGTLWSILQKNGQLSWELRRRLALDTARAMNYLHERATPILHRDLKSLNLLLDENKRIKLADFGWTKGLQNYMTGKIGTYQWMAPEVVSSHQYTEKADVFSFAIILWEIASREAPYRNIPGVQVAQDVLNKDLRPTVPKKTPDPFAALMRKCWAKSPQNRPSFSQIIQELEQMQLPI